MIPFLDVSSILALANVQPLVSSLLQRSFIWKKLVSRSAISGSDLEGLDREKIGDLVEILNLLEDPEPRLLQLLHAICERYPKEISGEVKEGEEELTYFDLDSVFITCILHQAGHKVSTAGFELLELIEGAMGTTLQKLQKIELEQLDENVFDFSLALAFMARIKRQDLPLQKVKINRVFLWTTTTANLLESSEQWDIRRFYLQRDFGQEAWSWLAQNLERNKYAVEKIWLSAVVMARAKSEDLKRIWDQNSGCEWSLEEHSPAQQGTLPQPIFGQVHIFVGGSTVEENGKILDPAWEKVKLILKKVKLQRIREKVNSELDELEEELEDNSQQAMEKEQSFLQKLSQIRKDFREDIKNVFSESVCKRGLLHTHHTLN